MAQTNNGNIYHVCLKKYINKIQKYCNYVYRKDGTFYIHEEADECVNDTQNCKHRFTCGLCFKSSCHYHSIIHAEMCKGRAADKDSTNHLIEDNSILQYGVPIAISILKNTNTRTFQRLLFSHYLFRRAVIEDKECRRLFRHTLAEKSINAQSRKGIKDSDICKQYRCRKKRWYCVNCTRLFCWKHISSHNIVPIDVDQKDRDERIDSLTEINLQSPFNNQCKESHSGNIRCILLHSNIKGEFIQTYNTSYNENNNRKMKSIIKSWDEETWLNVLRQKWDLITQIDRNQFTDKLFKYVWRISKYKAYSLLDISKRTSEIYVEMLRNLQNDLSQPKFDNKYIDDKVLALSGISKDHLTQSAIEEWLLSHVTRKLDVVLDFTFITDNHIKLAVDKECGNFEFIPKHLQTKWACSYVLEKNFNMLPWCNLDLIDSGHAAAYILKHGDDNNVIFRHLYKRFPDACQRALKEFNEKQKFMRLLRESEGGSAGGSRRGGVSGGLMSLVAMGAQDLYLIGPTIKFF